MESPELYAKIEQEIAQSHARYEAEQNDAQFSTTRAVELETLRLLLQRLRDGETREALRAWLREEMPRLEEELEREFHCPTFDWYDEHYHYKRLAGERDACRKMEQLLAEEP